MYWTKDFIVLLWSVKGKKKKQKTTERCFSSCSRRLEIENFTLKIVTSFGRFFLVCDRYNCTSKVKQYQCLKLGIILTQYNRHAYSFAFLIETQQSLKWKLRDIVYSTAGRTIWKLCGLCCLTIVYRMQTWYSKMVLIFHIWN